MCGVGPDYWCLCLCQHKRTRVKCILKRAMHPTSVLFRHRKDTVGGWFCLFAWNLFAWTKSAVHFTISRTNVFSSLEWKRKYLQHERRINTRSHMNTRNSAHSKRSIKVNGIKALRVYCGYMYGSTGRKFSVCCMYYGEIESIQRGRISSPA